MAKVSQPSRHIPLEQNNHRKHPRWNCHRSHFLQRNETQHLSTESTSSVVRASNYGISPLVIHFSSSYISLLKAFLFLPPFLYVIFWINMRKIVFFLSITSEVVSSDSWKLMLESMLLGFMVPWLDFCFVLLPAGALLISFVEEGERNFVGAEGFCQLPFS